MLDKKWSVVLRDLVLPTLAILLTAYNVFSLTTARKDSYNDILFSQQMTGTNEIAERLSVYQGELTALIQLPPETPRAEVATQTDRAIDAGRSFSKAYTKWAPIMPNGVLLEVSRYYAIASRILEPFRAGAISSSRIAQLDPLRQDLTRNYARVFQRMRKELGVDTLNDESKHLLEKIQTDRIGKPDPVS